VAGIGGQGVLSAGRWLGNAAAAAGLDMVVRQVHGLSQRGGSVQSSVVIGGARSPEIPDGAADVLVAFEPMEAARALAKVSERTAAIVNLRPLLPASLQSSGRPYPPLSSLIDPVRDAAGSMLSVDATALAEEAGSHRVLNVVMLGMLAGSDLLPYAEEGLRQVILAEGLEAFAALNERAFDLGVEAAKRQGRPT
jgi:indolepyruvate ferredoxin oxidoreductase beta subunit